MKVRIATIIVLGGLLLGGCATKKYVAETVDPVKAKVDQQGTTLEQTRQELDKTNTQLSATTEKANSADSRAGEAINKANTADQKADAASTKADQIKGELKNQIANLDDYKPVAEATVQFKFNSDQLSKEGKEQLDRLVAEHGTLKRYFVAVEGFTDRSGPEDYNLALSRRRADRVVNYLVSEHTIPVYRIQLIGLGKAKPADDGKGRSARAKNRRVEVTMFSADEGVTAMQQTRPGTPPPQKPQQ